MFHADFYYLSIYKQNIQKAGTEHCQAQVKLDDIVEVVVEVVVKALVEVTVQLLLRWVGRWSDKTKKKLI